MRQYAFAMRPINRFLSNSVKWMQKIYTYLSNIMAKFRFSACMFLFSHFDNNNLNTKGRLMATQKNIARLLSRSTA